MFVVIEVKIIRRMFTGSIGKAYFVICPATLPENKFIAALDTQLQ